MAITVRDIQEKEFSTQKLNGYNVEEVDDFLDELAEQLGALVRENLLATEELKQLRVRATTTVQVEEKPVKPEDPAYDEPSYFKNLEQAMRETLISSQRIADETVADARKQAQEIVTSAQAEAEEKAKDANEKLAAAQQQVENLKKEFEDYRTAALAILEQQQSAIDGIRASLK